MVSQPPTTLGQQIESPQSRGEETCPVCTGFLVRLAGSWRCARCCFTFCEGCEGEPAVCFSEPED
jgi:hypothetical protein